MRVSQTGTFIPFKQTSKAGKPLQFGMFPHRTPPGEKEVLDKLREQLSWVPNIQRAEVHEAQPGKDMGNILLQLITPDLQNQITQQLISQKLAHESPSGELIYQFGNRQFKVNFSESVILR
jgi:hypothetical protein